MAIIATDTGGGSDFEPVPAGTHIALCDMVVDLGKQVTTYMGAETVKHQIVLRWQIPAERVQWEVDGQKHEGPVIIYKTYTLSLSEKANLRKDLEAWRAQGFTEAELKGFDVANLLGAPATLGVTHVEKNGKTYANVTSLGRLPKGTTAPVLEGEALLYDSEHEGNYSKLPKWLRERVDRQIQPTGQTDPADPDAWRSEEQDDYATSDDIPF